MGKCRVSNKVLRTLFLVLIFMTGMALHSWAAVRPADVPTPASGNIFINVEGSFFSETKDTILARVNEIRQEAYDEGYVTQYVPLTWSASLEAIAQLRSVEADLFMAHDRPSGKSCFTVSYGNHTSNAENLAWNYSGMMAGIEQWYGEKTLYDQGIRDSRVGHYVNLINASMQSIGIACFRAGSGYYCITSESGRFTDTDQTKSSLTGAVTQLMETKTDYLTDLTLVGETALKTGDTSSLVLKAAATFRTSQGRTTSGEYDITENISWTSSDTSVATVSSDGTVTAIGPGEATITAAVGTLTCSTDIGVDKDDLQYAKVLFEQDSYEYCAAEIEPVVTVTLLGETLEKHVDYSVSYSDNVNAGQGTVIITGLGDHAGQSTTAVFTITQLDPDSFILAGSSYKYTGNPITPTIQVHGSNGWITPPLSDFDITYDPNPVDAGSISMDVSGNGRNIRKYYFYTFYPRITPASIYSDVAIAAIADQPYTGAEVTPELSLTYNGMTLQEGTDYTVVFSNNTAVGTASVKITGKGNYSGSKTVTFAITPLPLLEDDVTLAGNGTFEYTGSSIQPGVRVTHDGTELTEGTDYTVAYGENTAVGTGTVTVAGKGNYGGTVTKTFTIIPATITEDMVSLGVNPSYTGFGVKVPVKVTWNEMLLTEETDYLCAYSNNVNVGENTALVTITGTGNFSGSVTKMFSITPADLSEAEISGLRDAEYTGSEIRQIPVVKLGEVTLTERTDYMVSYSDDLVNIGTVTVTVTGIGNYTGMAKGSYKITPVDITQTGSISEIADQTYTGNAITPRVRVTLGETVLTEGTDYKVSYENNVNAGTATVTAAGRGNYTGTVKKSFTISPAVVTDDMVTLGASPSYTGSGVMADVMVTWNGTALTENTDYTCAYSNNVNVGTDTATVTIIGSGNFAGSVTKTFSITPADLSGAQILGLSDAEYTGSEIRQTPQVKLGGVTLTEGTDYTVAYSGDLVNVGTVTVTVTGCGNYTGTASGSYTIVEKGTEPETDPTGSHAPQDQKTPAPNPVLGTVKTLAGVAQSLPENGDAAGSTYNILQLKVKKAKKTSVKIAWKPVKGAAGYVIYGAPCGSRYARLTDVKTTSFTQAKLKKGKYYKYFVAAYDRYGNILASSKTVHIATSGGKKGNTKSVKLNKKKVTLAKGKKFKLKATLKNGNLKVSKHRKVAYESDNPAVATVSNSGKIKAVGTGTCHIYAYAQNGVSAKCTVKVSAKK